MHTFKRSTIEDSKGKVRQAIKTNTYGVKVSGKRNNADGIDEDDNASS